MQHRTKQLNRMVSKELDRLQSLRSDTKKRKREVAHSASTRPQKMVETTHATYDPVPVVNTPSHPQVSTDCLVATNGHLGRSAGAAKVMATNDNEWETADALTRVANVKATNNMPASDDGWAFANPIMPMDEGGWPFAETAAAMTTNESGWAFAETGAAMAANDGGWAFADAAVVMPTKGCEWSFAEIAMANGAGLTRQIETMASITRGSQGSSAPANVVGNSCGLPYDL